MSFDYTMANNLLAKSITINDLRLQLNNKLSFMSHIDSALAFKDPYSVKTAHWFVQLLSTHLFCELYIHSHLSERI